MPIAARIVLLLFALVVSPPAFAMNTGAGCGGDCASCHSLSDQEAATLLKGVGTVKGVKPAQVRGLFEVAVERDGKTGVVFVDYGKSRLIAGQIFDIATLQPLGSAGQGPKRTERLDPSLLKKEHSLVMGNPKGGKRLFVFTDPECPYCAQFHAELKKLVDADGDVAVYIKMFPLKMHPNAYDKARVILGAGSLELLEKSFAGGKLPPPGGKEGKKAVDATVKFAQAHGIDSTPTLVLSDGRILPGVRTAAEMRELLAGK